MIHMKVVDVAILLMSAASFLIVLAGYVLCIAARPWRFKGSMKFTAFAILTLQGLALLFMFCWALQTWANTLHYDLGFG